MGYISWPQNSFNLWSDHRRILEKQIYFSYFRILRIGIFVVCIIIHVQTPRVILFIQLRN